MSFELKAPCRWNLELFILFCKRQLNELFENNVSLIHLIPLAHLSLHQEVFIMASTMSAGSVPGSQSTPSPSPAVRTGAAGANLQKILQRKAQVKSLSMEKKKEKVAMYSSCKSQEGGLLDPCKCTGWKNPTIPGKGSGTVGGGTVGGGDKDGASQNGDNSSGGKDSSQPSVGTGTSGSIDPTTPCRVCSHSLRDHITHLENVSEDELNRLLAIVVDLENLFIVVNAEEDPDTKQVYYYLFKLLRKSIVMLSKPIVEGPLGQPPFEEINITKVRSSVYSLTDWSFGLVAN